jgi:hypothetical protein
MSLLPIDHDPVDERDVRNPSGFLPPFVDL